MIKLQPYSLLLQERAYSERNYDNTDIELKNELHIPHFLLLYWQLVNPIIWTSKWQVFLYLFARIFFTFFLLLLLLFLFVIRKPVQGRNVMKSAKWHS